MIDPFTQVKLILCNAEVASLPDVQKYGNWGALMVVPAAVSEIFWCAAILGALGSTLHVILHLDDVGCQLF